MATKALLEREKYSLEHLISPLAFNGVQPEPFTSSSASRQNTVIKVLHRSSGF